ncbi:MAG: hypothetical protein OXP71_02220 [Candidatus Poribacteria bacterium]|nr:hypothetical protein [Candidatus Poribacteria bacterium]
MVRSTIFGVVIVAFVCSCSSLYVHPPSTPNNSPNREQPTAASPPDSGTERWECYDYVYDSKKLGTLTADRIGANGTVDFAGIFASTQFSIQGIDRRWDWGWGTDGRSDYAFVISPDGTGTFYDFSFSSDGTAKPSDLFKCARR